jgi:uncharacterized protein (TIGR00251 family)
MVVEPIANGVRLRVKVQPRASRTEITGLHDGAIRVRIAAPPVDGEANQELIRFLAKQLGVPRSAVTIVAGETARTKRVDVIGINADTVTTRLSLPL